jgi:hypothetical protein
MAARIAQPVQLLDYRPGFISRLQQETFARKVQVGSEAHIGESPWQQSGRGVKLISSSGTILIAPPPKKKNNFSTACTEQLHTCNFNYDIHT